MHCPKCEGVLTENDEGLLVCPAGHRWDVFIDCLYGFAPDMLIEVEACCDGGFTDNPLFPYCTCQAGQRMRESARQEVIEYRYGI